MKFPRIRKSVAGIATAALLLPMAAYAASGPFVDVPDDHIFSDEIAWMYDNGITKGCNPPTNTMYCPERDISRGEVAAFFYRYDKLVKDSTGTARTAGTAGTAGPTGPEGPQGPAGPQGEPGGLNSVVVETNSASWSGGQQTQTLTATCPASHVVLGGGFQLDSGNSGWSVTASYPGGNGWTVVAGGSGETTLTAFATCAES